MPGKRILVVDDDAFNRQGVCTYLQNHGFETAEAGNTAEARALVAEWEPDVAIVDIVMPPDPGGTPRLAASEGMHLANELKLTRPGLGIVLFSAYEDRGRELTAMLARGDRGIAYKIKGCLPSELLAAVRGVAAGRIIIDPEVTDARRIGDALLDNLSADERAIVVWALSQFATLTPTEQTVARRLAASYSNSGIAAEQILATKTVENTLSRVYEKLGFQTAEATGSTLNKRVLLAKTCLIAELRGDFDV